MSVKALIIEGGETVIADVQEVHDKQKQEFLKMATVSID